MNSDSILERYKKELENHKNNEDYDLPKSFIEGQDNSVNVDKKYMNEYQKTLDNLRHNDLDMENRYKSAMSKIRNLNEEDLTISNSIKDVPVSKIMVKHAYCPECGKELINKYPPMFNPFTHEKQCIHECECGMKYNLEYSYPRIVFYDDNDSEIFAHCE